MKYRSIEAQTLARATSDGDGVRLKRVFGGANLEAFDPFLMMDEFGSASADDYIGGFPAHPHRGFETITYMLQGKMEHQDHMGNRGLLSDGGVQWMTAGAGIIHSEMPKQTEGLMRGFQIWLNLPAKDKMQPAHYEDVEPGQIPVFQTESFFTKVIAGSTQINDLPVEGYFSREATQPIVLDLHIPAGESARIALPDSHRAVMYVYEGSVMVGAPAQAQVASKGMMSRLSDAGDLFVTSSGGVAQVMILAGRPLNEPIVHYGPFVMNSPEEIEQALLDYREGRLTG